MPSNTNKKTLVNKDKVNAFNEAIEELNKEFTSETGTMISRLGDKSLDIEKISSGSSVIDSISGGGIPKGRLIEIFGPEGSGKTSVALTIAGNVQKKGGNVAIVDLEHALDPKYARRLGVDIESLAVAQPDYAEQALDLIERLASSGVVDLIIVDSVAALVPKSEFEGKMEDQTMALVARLLSRSLKKLVATAKKNKTTVILINQVREKVGFVLGNPEVTTGGKALPFYASMRIRVAKAKKVTEDKKIIGNEVKVKIVKNKVAPPFGEGTTILTFNKGINRAAEILKLGEDCGIIDRPNGGRTYVDVKTGEIIGKSKAEVIQTLDNDPEMLERMSETLRKFISDNLYKDDVFSNDDADKESDEPEGMIESDETIEKEEDSNGKKE